MKNIRGVTYDYEEFLKRRDDLILRRSEYINKLSVDYQLGQFVGLHIIHKYLPTLPVDIIKSNIVVDMSEADILEYQSLLHDYYATVDENYRVGNRETISPDEKSDRWEKYISFSKAMSKKYLPNILECRISPLNIKVLKDFKDGLISELSDCDMCSYNLNHEKIRVYYNSSLLNTIIEFTL